MILDSVSFFVEYQYVKKPLLFLGNSEGKLGDFGDKLSEVLYRCDGNDEASVESFIRNVVINRNDTMKEERDKFFNENLNYYAMNGNKTASEMIYNDVIETFGL